MFKAVTEDKLCNLFYVFSMNRNRRAAEKISKNKKQNKKHVCKKF